MKIWKTLFAALFVIGITTGFATTDSIVEKKPARVCEKAEPIPYGYNYRKDIGLTCPNDFYLYGEFLLFKSVEEGLELGIRNASADNQVNLPLAGGVVEGFSNSSHDWDWNFGARVGVGAYLAHDGWNLDIRWTYIRMHQTRELTVQEGERFLPYFIDPSLDNEISKSSARWTGSLNCIDLILGKPYNVSRQFVINPFIGLRGAFMDNDFVARYQGQFDQGTAERVAKMKASEDTWLFGLRSGVHPEFTLGSGFELFADFSASLLFGKFDLDQDLKLIAYHAGEVDHSYSLNHEFYNVVPNMELQIGASWAHKFDNDKYRILLSGAYEFDYWWNQNHMKRFFGSNTTLQRIASNDNISRNDLSFNGLTFRVQFDF